MWILAFLRSKSSREIESSFYSTDIHDWKRILCEMGKCESCSCFEFRQDPCDIPMTSNCHSRDDFHWYTIACFSADEFEPMQVWSFIWNASILIHVIWINSAFFKSQSVACKYLMLHFHVFFVARKAACWLLLYRMRWRQNCMSSSYQ